MIFSVFLLLIGFSIKSSLSLFDFPSRTNGTFKILLKTENLYALEKQGLRSYTYLNNLEKIIKHHNISGEKGSISHALLLERFPDNDSKNINQVAQKLLKTTNAYLHMYCNYIDIPLSECISFIVTKDLPSDSQVRQDCHSINAKSHRFRRLLPPNYIDGVYQMKGGGFSNPLEYRYFSFNTEDEEEYEEEKEDDDNNLAFIQWAQFIEHDLIKPVVTTMHNGDPIECCDPEYFHLAPRLRHPFCEPLKSLKPRKNTFDRRTCLNYVRSSLATNENCHLGAASQLNQASSELDLSQLYGYTEESKNRMKSAAFLKADGDFLPYAESKDRNEFCVEDTEKCYMAGDSRVNANPYTITLYTIFLRNHNKIAKEITNMNSIFSHDDIFEMAKKRNIKAYTEIIFKEWLPILIGSENIKNLAQEKLRKHDIEDLNVSNEFGVAAARFYYSMIPSRQKESKSVVITFDLQIEFYNSSPVDESFDAQIDDIMRQKALAMDSTYTNSILKRYFSTKSSKSYISGADVLALDIQTGRDHGLQGYTEYVKACSGIEIKKWKDLINTINKGDILKLKSIYNNVEYIDLIIGGISEKIDKDAIVGPTFNCILSEQFSKLRQLHYDIHGNDVMNFSKPNCNFGAALICDTTSLNKVPRNVFFTPSERNELITCTDVLRDC